MACTDLGDRGAVVLGAGIILQEIHTNVRGYCQPLADLTKKDVPWGWDTRCEYAFNELKRLLSEASVLAPPDEDKPFVISTDASGEAVGAVLSQEGRPTAFTSRRLKPAEQIKSAYERELITLVYAIVKWWCYVEGKTTRVTIDHATPRHYQTQPTISRQQARYVTLLARPRHCICQGEEEHGGRCAITMPPRSPLAEEFVELDKLCAIEAVTLDKGFIKKLKELGREYPDYSQLMEEPSKQYKQIGDLLYRDMNGYLVLYVPDSEPLKRLIIIIIIHILRPRTKVPPSTCPRDGASSMLAVIVL